MKQIEAKVLTFDTINKESAVELYNKVIKPKLEEMGYKILKYNCYPYKLKRGDIVPDCDRDTLNEF